MIESASKETAESYDFAGLRYSATEAKLVCLQTNNEILLRRNLSEFLLLLLKKPGEVVSYQELHKGVTAWSIYKEASQLKRTIHATKGELIKNLRSLNDDFDLIESVPAKGYRLNTKVSESFSNDAAERQEITQNEKTTFFGQNKKANQEVSSAKYLGGHRRQVFFACTVYAILFVIALFLEAAYQFDDFKTLAFKLTIPIFLWIWLTSVSSLFVTHRLIQKYDCTGFIFPILIFLSSAILLHLFLGAFLPQYPITKANFQTYPSHAAYLKNIFYFCAMAIFFIVLPWSTIIWLEKEIDKGNKKVIASLKEVRRRRLILDNLFLFLPKLLLGLTISGFLVSLVATAHLLENLHLDVYHNLFTQLVWWRLFLCFALAAECLIWYSFSLYSIRTRFLELSI